MDSAQGEEWMLGTFPCLQQSHADMSALKSLGLLVRQAGQAFESFGAYLQGSGPELGPHLLSKALIAYH